MSTTQSRRGVPPLRNLQAILDAKATTRAQLTRRCGLSPPTIRRAIEGRAGVSAATARKVAQALGVPQQALYAELTPEELAHEARYPTITAGREYIYPEKLQNGKASVGTPYSAPESEGAEERDGEDESVTLRRGDLALLQDEMERMEARLETIEETLLEVASRPIAEFEVSLVEKETRHRDTAGRPPAR